MPAAPRLRNALLIHGLGLGAAAAGIVVKWALGAGSEADAFHATGLVAGFVAIVWSVVLAIRAARESNGAKRWAAAIVVLSLFELNVPAFIGWAWLARESRANFDIMPGIAAIGYPAFIPAATAIFLMVLLAIFAQRLQSVWRRRTAVALCGLAVSFTLLVFLPCELWLLGAAERTRFNNGWNSAMNAALPDSLKVATDRLLAADDWKAWPRATHFRREVCVWGRLPVSRLEQNVCDLECPVAVECWGALKDHPDDQLRIALAVARGEMSTDTYLQRLMGQLLATQANAGQLDGLLDPERSTPAAVVDGIISNLYGRIDALPALERRMAFDVHADTHLFAAVEVNYDIAAANATVDDTECRKALLLRSWRESALPSNAVMTLAARAHDSDPAVRRLAIMLLARTLEVKLYATPPPSAVDQHGASVATTLEESEEAARIAESARQIFSAGEYRKCIRNSQRLDEREWDWFAESFPEEAMSLARDIVKDNSARNELITCAVILAGHNCAPDEIRALIDERKIKNSYDLVKAVLSGIAIGQLHEFESDIHEVIARHPGKSTNDEYVTMYEGTLCALMTPDEVKALFEPLLALGNRAGLVKAAHLFGYIHDEKQRLEIARRMMSFPGANDRHAIFINAINLSPLIFSDPRLRAAWVETLTALLDDPDLVARRAAAFALADYFRFSFTSMPRPAEGATAEKTTEERVILSAGRPLPETAREKEEMDALRKKIAANKKMKASRGAAPDQAPK